MGHYIANLRDIEFCLFDLLERESILGKGMYADVDRATAMGMLEEVKRLCENDLAASFIDGDRVGTDFNKATGEVKVPESFKKSYRAYVDGGWGMVDAPAALGGTEIPPSVRWAIAEMVLGYTDTELSIRIQQANIQDYHIIRYRDDYRIFSNNPQDAELITKILTEILIELGMRLNAQKTLVSNNVIRDSIKPDKIYWIAEKNGSRSIQEHLLLIHNLSDKFPNSGSLSKALGKFYKRIQGLTELYNIEVLISILVDIMYKNPRTYPIASAILSKLLSLLNDPTKRDRVLQSTMTKFAKIPNTGHIKIWLQRLTIKIDRPKLYNEDLCKKVNDPAIQIWNSDWLNNTLKTLIATTPIIDEQIIQDIDVVINQTEVQLFKPEYDDNAEE